MGIQYLVPAVRASILVERRNDGEMFAAHIDPLAITAYGRTFDVAYKRAIKMFRWCVWLHRDAGNGALERRLKQSKARVEWVDKKEIGTMDTNYRVCLQI